MEQSYAGKRKKAGMKRWLAALPVGIAVLALSGGTVWAGGISSGHDSGLLTAYTDTESSGSYILGDVNGSGTVNISDVIVLERYVADMEAEIDDRASDINADGAVNQVDVTLLERYIENVDDNSWGIGEEISETESVESVSLNVSEMNLDPGESGQLEATILPESAADTEITWSSSDESVATVSADGLVTAADDGYGMAEITVQAGGCEVQCTVYVGNMVFFYGNAEEMTVTVDDYEDSMAVYTYGEIPEDYASAWVACLPAGTFSYTATAEGYYASVCGFTVSESGTVSYTTEWTDTVKETYGLDEMLDGETATFYLSLETFVQSPYDGAWDGVTLDVSWFDPDADSYYISTPEQLAGLAAIVNGIYNAEITTIIDNGREYTPVEYASYAGAKIVAGCSAANDSSGANGSNQVTSDDYYYSALGYDFDGKTVYLTADLDMGGYQDSEGNWTGARYMPIGGQYQMHYVKTEIGDGYSHIGSSFNGTFDGCGHIVYNIYCDRYSVTAYGDSSSVGLIGRLGNHDNDYKTWQEYGDNGGNYPAVEPTVRNVAVDGWIYARRSVGGIVGKTGHTAKNDLSDGSRGAIIENCVNFATVTGTDAKGCGGIVGAGWNGGVISNCANFGAITNVDYSRCPVGGISGSNENIIINCYNVGLITAQSTDFAMGIGTNNGGGSNIQNCYWLTGMSAGGGYYNGGSSATVYEVVDDFNGSGLTAAEYIVSGNLADDLNGDTSRIWTTASSSDSIYGFLENADYAGAPIPRVFTTDTASAESLTVTGSPEKLTYVEGETFDTTGLVIRVYWSDGTSEVVEPELSVSGALTTDITSVTTSVSVGSLEWEETWQITVLEYTVESMEVTVQPTTRTYNEGDSFDPTGLRVTITYTNGLSVTAEWQSDGTFVDVSDGETVYDITIEVEDPLTVASNGVGVTLSYTYEGTTVTAVTSTLTVTSSENEPEQDEDGVYLVGTADELDWVAAQVNDGLNTSISFRLTADIVANSDFTPIGSYSGNKFSGTLDGDGHTITLSIDSTSSYMALFAGVTDGAVIRNLLIDGTVTGKSYVAGLIAYVGGEVTVENCGNLADITGTSAPTGGLIARVDGDLTMTNCFNRGSVTESGTALGCLGGLIAQINSGATVVIENCYNWGSVTGWASGTSYGVGGLVGNNYGATTITNSYNAGVITNLSSSETAAQYSGSIVGCNRKTVSIDNCYWLEGTSTYAVGSANETTAAASGSSITADELITLADEGELGEMFISNDGCLPVLKWQDVTGHETEDGICIYCGKEVLG